MAAVHANGEAPMRSAMCETGTVPEDGCGDSTGTLSARDSLVA